MSVNYYKFTPYLKWHMHCKKLFIERNTLNIALYILIRILCIIFALFIDSIHRKQSVCGVRGPAKHTLRSGREAVKHTGPLARNIALK